MWRGDFNQFDPLPFLAEHPELKEVETCPTRGGRKIDKMLTNFNKKIVQHGVIASLQVNRGLSGYHETVRDFESVEKPEHYDIKELFPSNKLEMEGKGASGFQICR